MACSKKQPAFTLVELLVTLVVISLLSMLVVPSIGKARGLANSVTCTNNLRNLGAAMSLYQSENHDEFCSYVMLNTPGAGLTTYFWGSSSDPVAPLASPFMKTTNTPLKGLWCPAQPWGSYVPQASVSEPTTTYGYNTWCLAPPPWSKKNMDAGRFLRPKKRHDIKNPTELFVFADSAMYWAPGGVSILQNSAYLEPVTGNFVQTPTTHFRHDGRANAVTVSGSVKAYNTEGWKFEGKYKPAKLGFVGTENRPHYDQ